MLTNPKELKKVLGGYAKFLVNQSRANLEEEGKNSSGNLSNSIRQVVEMKPNGFELIIYGLDYGKFVDQGVSGTSSVDKAPNSPYKFGSGTGREGGTWIVGDIDTDPQIGANLVLAPWTSSDPTKSKLFVAKPLAKTVQC